MLEDEDVMAAAAVAVVDHCHGTSVPLELPGTVIWFLPNPNSAHAPSASALLTWGNAIIWGGSHCNLSDSKDSVYLT